MKEYQLPYGKGYQRVMLPEERVVQVIDAPAKEQKQELETMVHEALAHPIGSEPLSKIIKPGETVALIVSDITRVWSGTDRYLPYVVAELNKIGVPDKDIFVIIATGTHRLNNEAEKEEILGKDLYKRIKVYDHDPGDEGNVFKGTTSRGTPVYLDKRAVEADRVILTGGLTPHLFAGFGGGRKSVMPGISSAKTINHNHLLALTDEVGGGVNPETCMTAHIGNRVSEDMCEVCAFLKPCFLVNSIMDANGNFYKLIAGDWYKAWEQGTRDVMEQQGVAAKAKSDVVIVSAGGYPKDINLYQGMKSFVPAAMTVKEGGIIIAMLECPDIKEPPVFFDCFRYSEPLSMEKDLRAGFTIPFYVAFYLYCLAYKYTVILVTDPKNFDEVKKTGEIPVATLEEAWAMAEAKLKEQGRTDYTVNVIPHGVNTIPLYK